MNGEMYKQMINRPYKVFVGSTTPALNELRDKVRNWLGLGPTGVLVHSVETIPAGGSNEEKLHEAITTADLFVGIYEAETTAADHVQCHKELNIALKYLPKEKLCFFRERPVPKQPVDDKLWRKMTDEDLFIQTFWGQEELLLHVLCAVSQNRLREEPTSTHSLLTLSAVFDLGPQPHWLVYGRRSQRPRTQYGSLETLNSYMSTCTRVSKASLKTTVEPETDSKIFEKNGALLLSGPPTSDCSKEYFKRLRDRGIRLFSGSCTNHLGEDCSHKSACCPRGQDAGVTGCASVNDEQPVPSYRDAPVAKHVAMLVRTPSPWCPIWPIGRNSPSILFAAGCHSLSGLLACNCVTDEDFMTNLLQKTGWTPHRNIPPWFAAIISQDGNEKPVVKFVESIHIDTKETWCLRSPSGGGS